MVANFVLTLPALQALVTAQARVVHLALGSSAGGNGASGDTRQASDVTAKTGVTINTKVSFDMLEVTAGLRVR